MTPEPSTLRRRSFLVGRWQRRAVVEEIVVEAPPSLEPMAERLRRIDRRRLRGTLRLLGLEGVGPPIHVVLAPEDTPGAAVPGWVAGYARPEESLVVLLPERQVSYPDDSFDDLLHHELTHVLLHRAAGGADVPRWFTEGVALLAGDAWKMTDSARLTMAMLLERPGSLDTLDRRFRQGRGAIRRAYVLAGAFVRDLVQERGRGVVARILDELAAGHSFEDAFRRATGTPLELAERRFWESRDWWNRWVPALTSTMSLWLGITFLALWAIRRRQKRDAEVMERWEREDALQRAEEPGRVRRERDSDDRATGRNGES